MPHLNGNNPANDPNSKPVKNRSAFKPNRSLFQTMKFGLNTPHFAMEAVEGDQVSVRVASDVDTLSLKAPVMCPVKMSKDYFFVTMRALLPKNAELVITNPLSGDDIVADDVNIAQPWSFAYYMLTALATEFNNQQTKAASASDVKEADTYLLRALIKMVQIGEPMCSAGSLLAQLGMNFSKGLQFGMTAVNHRITLDKTIDALCRRLVDDVEQFTFSSNKIDSTGSTPAAVSEYTSVTVVMDQKESDSFGTTWTFQQFLDFIRQGHCIFEISIPTTGGMRADVDTSRRQLRYTFDPHDTVNPDRDYNAVCRLQSVGRHLNLSRLVAYQLACAQFYTDDAIDYVYSTQLWHENQQALANLGYGSQYTPQGNFFYVWNGTRRQYDCVSGKVMDLVLSQLRSNVYASATISGDVLKVWPADVPNIARLGYFTNIFGYTRSLKYRDFFCGSRPQPLAVGNVNVSVSSNQFSVVDVTKNIQIQRFLNQVNRVGRRFNEYVKGIFGVKPMPDAHDVIFLGHTTDIIGGEETENTGAAQLTDAQTVTSKFRTNSSRFAFEGSFSEPGILIGITNFDVVRPYTEAIDTVLHSVDRYEMFNPFMQNIGDQDIPQHDLILTLADSPFGYKLRYAEYKQAFDRAVGGFCEYLPGFCFPQAPGYYFKNSFVINPDFIRSNPAEFDQFYLSLVDYSLAGRFHFLIRQDITVDATRPMEAAPSIL